MILNRDSFSRSSFLRVLLISLKMKRLKSEKVYKDFKLPKLNILGLRDLYSMRHKKIPVYTGNDQLLRSWKNAKSCETICPSNAIKVENDTISINASACIICGECVSFAPEGIFKV